MIFSISYPISYKKELYVKHGVHMIPELLLKQWHLFTWTDSIEILVFSLLIYYFSLWLKADNKKNLLFMFYAYCLVIGISYTTHLTTLHTVSLYYAPVVLLLLIITHQHILQRNFIQLKNIKPILPKSSIDWLNLIIRCCLQTLNKKKSLMFIIEQQDSLETYFTTMITIQCQINGDILPMLINSPSFEHEKIIWITNQGSLKAINCTWHNAHDYVLFQAETKNIETWKQDALLYTAKTDAVALYCCPKTGSFTILAQGKIIENLRAESCLRILKQFITGTQALLKKDHYESNQKSSTEQLQS